MTALGHRGGGRGRYPFRATAPVYRLRPTVRRGRVPARPGTGVTAGKSVRPCVELAGITDILTKAYGSTSPKNLVKATLDALRQLQNREQVEGTRGVKLERGVGELVTAE